MTVFSTILAAVGWLAFFAAILRAEWLLRRERARLAACEHRRLVWEAWARGLARERGREGWPLTPAARELAEKAAMN